MPNGIGACLLGDAQQGVLDGCGDGDVVQADIDGDAEPLVVGRADLLQGRRKTATIQAGWAQLGQERLHVALCLLADALDRAGLLIARVGSAHPGGDHPQTEQVLGDRVVDLPREPGSFRVAGVAAGALPLGRQRGAELAGHGGEVGFQPSDLIPAGDRQGNGVVAVGDRDGGSFQVAYPADEAA